LCNQTVVGYYVLCILTFIGRTLHPADIDKENHTMTFNEIEQKVIEFRNDRNWEQFHQIKDLLLGLNIEVSELQELFLWKSKEQQAEIDIENIRDEVADIAIYLIYISKHYGIDLLEAINNKVDKNSIKYPVEKSRNSNKKYTEL